MRRSMFRLDSSSGAVSFTSADVAQPFTMSRKRCSFLISVSATSWASRGARRGGVSEALTHLSSAPLPALSLQVANLPRRVYRGSHRNPRAPPLSASVCGRFPLRVTDRRGEGLPGRADSSQTNQLTLELSCPCHAGYEFVLSRNPTRPINRPNALVNIRVYGELNEGERNPGVPGLLSRKREEKNAADEGNSGQRGGGSRDARERARRKRERLLSAPPLKNSFNHVVLLLLFAFFKPRVLEAHGGAGYTFGALAILDVLPPGRKPSRAQLSQKRAGHRLCHPPPGPAAIIRGAPGRLGVSAQVALFGAPALNLPLN